MERGPVGQGRCCRQGRRRPVFYSDGSPVLDYDEDELIPNTAEPATARPRSHHKRESTPHPAKSLLSRLSPLDLSSCEDESASALSPSDKHAEQQDGKSNTPAATTLSNHTISMLAAPPPPSGNPLLDRIGAPARTRRGRPSGAHRQRACALRAAALARGRRGGSGNFGDLVGLPRARLVERDDGLGR